MQIIRDDSVEKAKGAIEALDPSEERRIVKFDLMMPTGVQEERTFIQEPLGFFLVQQFTTMMTDVVEGFVKGEYGVKLGELFRGDIRQQIAMPAELNEESVNNIVTENMQIIEAFLQVIRLLPELQQDIFCLSLGVPRNQREWFKNAISEPPSRGGLTTDEGFDLIKAFIRQNAKHIRRFFEEQAQEVVEEFRLWVLQEEPEQVDSTATEETIDHSEPSTGGKPSSTSSQPIPASA